MTSIDRARVNGPRADQMKMAWQRFVEAFEPLRPDLYRYCRYLTRNAWDAEDLVQDALARALVTLGCVFQEIEQPRAWLFRVASNLWIDRQRRDREEAMPDVAPPAPPDERLSLEGRDAGATLIGRLSPQERAAILLKDVFDFTIDETAGILTTTPGAIRRRCIAGEASCRAIGPRRLRRFRPRSSMRSATRSTRATSIGLSRSCWTPQPQTSSASRPSTDHRRCGSRTRDRYTTACSRRSRTRWPRNAAAAIAVACRASNGGRIGTSRSSCRGMTTTTGRSCAT